MVGIDIRYKYLGWHGTQVGRLQEYRPLLGEQLVFGRQASWVSFDCVCNEIGTRGRERARCGDSLRLERLADSGGVVEILRPALQRDARSCDLGAFDALEALRAA